jgi:hypothetical protein
MSTCCHELGNVPDCQQPSYVVRTHSFGAPSRTEYTRSGDKFNVEILVKV